MSQIATRLCGIPCMVNVTRFREVAGNYSCVAEDPDEYYGWRELDYVICDQRGRPAPWLEKRASRSDIEELEADIVQRMREGDE